jgi:hypothetical protein
MFSFTPSVSQLDLCSRFAVDVYETVKQTYAARGQTHGATIIEQNRYGKVAELAAKAFLQSHDFPTTPVDFNIYQGKAKSHAPDLFANGYDFQVKSCKVNSRYPTSWSFDFNYVERIKQSKAYTPEVLLLTQVAEDYSVQIVGMVRLSEVLHRLRNPMAAHLQGSKKVLYAEDLQPTDFVTTTELFDLTLGGVA